MSTGNLLEIIPTDLLDTLLSDEQIVYNNQFASLVYFTLKTRRVKLIYNS